MKEETITVDVKKIIQFLDVVNGYSEAHSASVVAVVGEDLAAACFKKYLARLYPKSVTAVQENPHLLKNYGFFQYPVTCAAS